MFGPPPPHWYGPHFYGPPPPPMYGPHYHRHYRDDCCDIY